uniref:CARD domain-containing protein n=1 Tax=Plectus sambesii TaxID=2011161 RepID=A0A914WM28_9BILA
MKKEHRELIENCRPQLKQAIVNSRCLDDIIDHLASRDRNGDYGLTSANIDAIRGGHHTNEAAKAGALLEILTTRGENAFDRFINAIIDSDQIGLIEILNSELPPDQHIRKQRSTSTTSANAPASQPVFVQAANNQGFVAVGPNSGMQVAPMHGGTQKNQIGYGNINCGNASGQQNTFNNQNNQGSMLGGPVHGGVVVFGDYHGSPHNTGSMPAMPNASEAAGGRSEHYNSVSMPQLSCGNEGASSAEEFDALLKMENILGKFDQLPKEKVNKLKKPLTDVLKNGVNDSRIAMSTMVDLEDLVNIHMSSVFTDGTVKKIRSVPQTSDAFYVFCEALTRSSIYGLFMFLIGLRSNKQEHLFHILCTEEFCKELLSVLDKA